jgi:single-strand DNA-binding protein
MPINVCIVEGNLTGDPEIREMTSGKSVGEFCMAHNRRYRNPQGEMVEEEPMFVEVNIFGQSVDFVKNNLRKGSRVLVQGNLRQDRWTSKDGQKRTKLYLVSDRIDILRQPGDGKNGAEERSEAETVGA